MSEKEEIKAKIAKYDPFLASIAVKELLVARERPNKEDIEKSKALIRELYKSLPSSKDRTEVISIALSEVNSEIVTEEVKKIKAELEGLGKVELAEIAKDLSIAIGSTICVYPIRDPCKHYNIICSACLRAICGYLIGGCGNSICSFYSVGCLFCLHACLRYGIDVCKAIWYMGPKIDIPYEVINPLVDSVMKEKLVDVVLENPKLSKAMRKLVLEMKARGEI